MDTSIEKEPVLMPYQDLPFNGDTLIERQVQELQKQFKIKTAIETGTCLGSTTLFLANEFKRVYTIEISEQYAGFARRKFNEISNIELFIGNSPEELKNILVNLEGRTFIFLDAHWGENCPLQKELEVIADFAKKKPIIAIHDFKVPGKSEYGYDFIHGQEFAFEWLEPWFDLIYGKGGYEYFYNTGIVEESAKRGIIFLVPKQ